MRLFPSSSQRFRLTSWIAIISFVSAASGCTPADEPPGPELAGGVIVDVRVAGPAGIWRDVMQERIPEDQLPHLSYDYRLADGRVTRDPAEALAASSFTVELDGNRRLGFRRDGDLVELVEAPPELAPSGAPPIRAVRLAGAHAEFYVGGPGWRARPPDVAITMSAATVELAERELHSLTMTLLLAPHQDRPQIAWAAVIAIVGVGWLAFCTGALLRCATDHCRCYTGYRLNCLGFTVARVRGEWDVSFEGLGCECVPPKIPGCEES